MSCLEMYNQKSTEQKGVGGPPMSPRISFSNDFADSSRSLSLHHHMRPNAYTDAPVSSDFEFSVSNYSMISADELFFKGRLLPLKENCSSSSSSSANGSFQKATTTTLRDELQNDDVDDDSESFSLRPPKNPTRWRGFLGLRKSHIGSKKSEKSVDKRTAYHHDDVSKSSQEFVD